GTRRTRVRGLARRLLRGRGDEAPRARGRGGRASGLRPLQHRSGGRRAARGARGAVTVPDPVELLRELIRFDTTNPPGNEEACVAHVESLLRSAGIESQRYEKAPGRPNLVARLRGRGGAAPLLLYGHVDVVTTAGQQWTPPPFDGVLEDGWLRRRGALDLEGGVALLVTALVRAHADRP